MILRHQYVKAFQSALFAHEYSVLACEFEDLNCADFTLTHLYK